jgi:hypothetical protein
VHDEHVELVVDENTLNLVNKSGKKPTLYYKNSSLPVKKMFVAYKERFKHVLFDNDSKTLKAVHDHKTYRWEYASANGKIHEHVEPLSQYVDSLGQTRLVEFNKGGEFSFVGQFEPLPCLRLPIRSIDHFVDVNAQLTAPRVDRLRAEFPWLTLYSDASSQHGDSAAGKRYSEFKQMKRLAEYLLWAACHLYAKSYAAKTTVSVDEWIAKETVVLDGYTYSEVIVKPIFDVDKLVVDGHFIFSSKKLEDRIRYNLSLISAANLHVYSSPTYHLFYKDKSNFDVVFPTQLALTKKEYFEQTRPRYVLHVLNKDNVDYIRPNILYFIKDFFNGSRTDALCIFFVSLELLVESANRTTGGNLSVEETRMNVHVYDQNDITRFTLGTTEPALDVIALNVNNSVFYGLILPSF